MKKPFGYLKQNEDNIIKLKLNVNDKSLKQWVNEKDLGIVYENIDAKYKYRFGVAFYGDTQDKIVEIIDFCQKSIKSSS